MLLVQVATVCRLLQYLIVTVGIFSIRKQKLAGTYKMPAIYVLIPLCVLACIYLGLKVSPDYPWIDRHFTGYLPDVFQSPGQANADTDIRKCQQLTAARGQRYSLMCEERTWVSCS